MNRTNSDANDQETRLGRENGPHGGKGRIEYVDPVALKNDPELDQLWPLEPPDGPAEIAFMEDVRDRGVLDPLKVSPDGKIVWDGRRRLRAARRFSEQVRTVPVLRCLEEDRLNVILGGIFHRRDLSRYAGIYLGFPWWRQVKEQALKRIKGNLLPGGYRRGNGKGGLSTQTLANLDARIHPSSHASLTGLAEKYGVDRHEFERCEKVVKLFEEHPEIREEWEPRLLKGEASFWQILSAVMGGGAAREKHAGQAPEDFRGSRPLQWFRAVKTLAVRLEDFESLNAQDRRTIRGWMVDYFGKGPQKRTSEQLLAAAEAAKRTAEDLQYAAEELAKKEEK